MKICAMILSLLINEPQKPSPPHGWLNCGFTAENVYKCKP
jgi:hypothetical protein